MTAAASSAEKHQQTSAARCLAKRFMGRPNSSRCRFARPYAAARSMIPQVAGDCATVGGRLGATERAFPYGGGAAEARIARCGVRTSAAGAVAHRPGNSIVMSTLDNQPRGTQRRDSADQRAAVEPCAASSSYRCARPIWARRLCVALRFRRRGRGLWPLPADAARAGALPVFSRHWRNSRMRTPLSILTPIRAAGRNCPPEARRAARPTV